jgi:hypothetical protein
MKKMQETKKRRAFYCSIVEFEEDFFPKSFVEEQARRPKDNQSIGAGLAQESFRRVRQDMVAGKLSIDN